MTTPLVIVVGVALILGLLTVKERRDVGARIASAEDDVKLGEKSYQDNCAACHGDKGTIKDPRRQA